MALEIDGLKAEARGHAHCARHLMAVRRPDLAEQGFGAGDQFMIACFQPPSMGEDLISHVVYYPPNYRDSTTETGQDSATVACERPASYQRGMWTLLHLWLDGHSRIARLALGEKALRFTLEIEKAWERRDAFIAMNPTGELPVLLHAIEQGAICGVGPIVEFLDEIAPDPPFLPEAPRERAEARRLFAWFIDKFDAEVHAMLVGEKVTRRLTGAGPPRSDIMRAGRANLRIHMGYLDWLCRRRDWLAGDRMTIADLAAAAQISCIDHLGDAPWAEHAHAKLWYAKMKSRPALRMILEDHVPGGPTPPKWYADPDF